MAAIEEGRKCRLTAGRRAGEEVVVTKMLEGNLAVVKNAKEKERKVSIKQLDPIEA